MEKRCEEPADMPAAGAAAWGRGEVTVPATAGSTAGIAASPPQAAGGDLQSLASLAAPRPSTRSATMVAQLALHTRPELDSDTTGDYMRDAIEHGGYRAALEYYGSDEAKASHTERHRLRAVGWLLGRLGLCDQVKDWLEGVASLPHFDHLLDDARSVPHAGYRTPPMWLETPRPVPRSVGDILTLEPVAAASDTGAVQDYIWTTMLILDAAGPICSHAGFGAAAFLVGTGSDWTVRGPAAGGCRYDPLRGARLHGAPEGCHRWIIADIDFEPYFIDEPHYYYDLADEGRRALRDAKAAGAPWPKAVEAAASGLGGMSLPDLLEGACLFGGPREDLGRMRDKLTILLSAWESQEKGIDAAAVSVEDQVLADLGAATARPDSDASAGTPLDRMLSLMAVLEPAHKIACEAKPSTGAEKAVLETLIGALQDQCRKQAGVVMAAAAFTNGSGAASACGGTGWNGEHTQQSPIYSDVSSALICDLYYCLGEYCESRSLAVDPCRLPLSEQFTDEEKAEIIGALTKDNPLYSDVDGRLGAP